MVNVCMCEQQEVTKKTIFRNLVFFEKGLRRQNEIVIQSVCFRFSMLKVLNKIINFSLSLPWSPTLSFPTFLLLAFLFMIRVVCEVCMCVFFANTNKSFFNSHSLSVLCVFARSRCYTLHAFFIATTIVALVLPICQQNLCSVGQGHGHKSLFIRKSDL